MPAPHDLILFDLDGTLSDPLIGIGRSINYALSHFGHPPLEISECSAYIGPPIDQSFKSITGVTSPIHLKALVTKYRERYADVGYSENVVYPGVAEALAKLSKANIPLAVCTSKREDFAERILEMFSRRAYFLFIDGGEVGVHKWQQVGGLLARGAVSAASVMVGDRAADLVAAHRNGLHSAGVLWGHGSREELVIEQPQYLFNSPLELPLLARVGRPNSTENLQ
jgi:phosphoglycolate phosphatase